MSTLKAFTVEQAARVTGVSPRRIRYWDTTGVLTPSLASGTQRGAFNRIYSFRDLVGLRTLGELRDRCDFSLQKLRVMGEWLMRHDDAPWSSLRFYVDGERIIFRDPATGKMIATDPPGQAAIPFELAAIAEETEAKASDLGRRQLDQIGAISRNRYVLGNAPVLARTRIPTVAVWNFHRAGYDAKAIIHEYPRLTERDVERAIAFECERQQAKRAG